MDEKMQLTKLRSGLSQFQNAISDAYAPILIQSPIADERFKWSFKNYDMQLLSLNNIYCEHGFTGFQEKPTNQASNIVLMSVTKGALCISSGSKVTTCNAGSIVLLDNTSPEMEQSDSTALLSLNIPLKFLFERNNDIKKMCGTPIDAQTGWASMLREFMGNVWSEKDNLDPKNPQLLLDILNQLIAPAFSQTNVLSTKYKNRQCYVTAAQNLIDEEIENPNLCPTFIAKHLKISTSYLYAIFRSAGITVNQLIIQRRLNRCKDQLSSGQFQHISITDIAFDNGFKDLSHFYHRFKDKFGVAPGVFRESNKTPAKVSTSIFVRS
ncbi:helix-turn-helix domain-containing protein [Porticoccaceae bacterium]|nr:helix-turn-helix domain-containing protein [Porticoccaceae bacterium]